MVVTLNTCCKGKELNDFQRNPLDIEILSNLRFGSLEIRDTSVTRVTNNFYSVQTLENATMEQERHRPLTEAEERKHKADTPKQKIVIDRIWNKRPDGFAFKMATKTGELVILEFKSMK